MVQGQATAAASDPNVLYFDNFISDSGDQPAGYQANCPSARAINLESGP